MGWGKREPAEGHTGDERASAGLPLGETENDGADEIAALFEGLQATTRVALFRKKPTYAAGYLCTIEISPGEMLDLDQIKLDWGGGEIQFRPLVQGPRGAKWAAGGRTIKLTGPPREHGAIHPLAGSPPRPAQPPPAVVAPVRDSGVMGIVQQLLDRDRTREQQILELLVEIRSSRRGGPPAPPSDLNALVAQIRGVRSVLAEIEPDKEPEDEPPRDRMMDMMFGLLEKKLEADGKLPGGSAAPPRRATRQAPADAPPLAPGWRLHSSPPGPQAAAASAPAPAARPQTADEIVAMLKGLDGPTRMDVLGKASAYLSKEDVMAWMGGEGDEEAEDVGT